MSSEKHMGWSPTEGLTYNPNDESYWNRGLLDLELTRVYDICHGCRLCFNLCPSFPFLFDAVDDKDNEVAGLTGWERQHVVDLCYSCRLCHVKCPYTPEDGHDFQLDFPALMLRARSVHVREQGGPALREKLLGNPDLLGKIATKAPRLANFANENPIQRRIMEATLGIHAEKKLPQFATETMAVWAKRNQQTSVEGRPTWPAEQENARVALFATCFVNFNNPQPGHAVVEILRKNDVTVTIPRSNCCGMPAMDGGDVEFAKRQAQQNVEAMLPLVREGFRIAAINPTCSLMMRKEYPTLLGTEDAKEFAAAVCDPHELLFELKRENKFNRDFKSTPGTVAYHLPCHLKAQSIGFRSRDLMKLIPGIELTMIDACTAHDGTWAMKKEYFAESMKWGEKVFGPIRETEPAVVATDCPLAAVQIEQGTGLKPMHPAEILARAYRADGFPTPVPTQSSE